MLILEKLKKTFLNQPTDKIDPGLPYNRIRQDLSSDEPLNYQMFFSDNTSDISFMDENQKVTTQAEKINMYRELARIPECSIGINEIVDEIIYSRDLFSPLKIDVNVDNEKIENAITKAFEKIILLFNNQKYFYKFVRDSYIDGQMNVLLNYDKKNIKKGIQSISFLDPRYLTFDLKKNIYKYVDNISINTNQQPGIFQWIFFNNLDKTPKYKYDMYEYNIEELVHQNFGLIGENGVILSELEQSIKPANILKTLTDLLVPMRMSHSVARRVWNVDVSELPNSKADSYMKDLVLKLKSKKRYNVETGEVQNGQHLVAMTEDYFFGNKAGGKGVSIDTIDETGNLGELSDIMYFYKLLYRSMGIPLNRISLDEQSQSPNFDLNSDSTTNEDMRFFMKITRLRAAYTDFFKQILKRELVATKVLSEAQFNTYKNNIKIYFKEENQFLERMNLTLFLKRIDAFSMAKDFGGKILPMATLYKEIFRMTDEEVRETIKKIDDESKDPVLSRLYNSEEDM